MQLNLPEDSVPVRELFERFFVSESTPERVRLAEPLGFDLALWRELVELEAPFMRLAVGAGGGGMSLFDTCLMMQEAGRHLASAPLAEAIVALRILGEVGGETATEWIEKARDGATVITAALRQTVPGKPQLVPGALVAKAVVTFDGDELAIEELGAGPEQPTTLADTAMSAFVAGQGHRRVLASGAEAARIWSAGVEEWKILTAAALNGLSSQALSMAAEYACERVAFDQFIGSYQGIAHPLANDIIDTDGLELMLWRTLQNIADDSKDAGATVSMLFWWAVRTATNSVAHAIHTFGGYGLTNEYDIQLYHRRAKTWGLVLGDPRAELIRGGRRLWGGETASLPEAGSVEVSFELPSARHPLADETRAIFDQVLDPAKHALGDENFESHDWEVHRSLGRSGLLFPQWPEKWGGRGADPDATRACNEVWKSVGYAGLPRGVTGMAGAMVLQFGQSTLQDEVLLRFARGDVTSCLGFTEPSGGSDVFAAKTRAVRDADDWVINGQKMFTSGAEWASYVLLLARTDPDAPKHKGLTLFLIPLDVPGVEIHPVHTFMDERTNATFYDNVRVADRYRLGEVNGGVKAMAAALTMEQGGSPYFHQLREMVEVVVEWAKDEERDGMPMLDHPDTLARLARVYAHACIGESLTARSQWAQINQLPNLAFGPASKVFLTQAFIDDSADLLDLTAPASLVRGREGLGLVEKGYRHSTATSIYGGTSEVLRSMIAEKRLGLPRSRS